MNQIAKSLVDSLSKPRAGLSIGAAIGAGLSVYLFGRTVLANYSDPVWTVWSNNKEMAPWFAASATSAGVIIALISIVWQIGRRYRDDQANRKSLERVLAGIAAVVEANVNLLRTATVNTAGLQAFIDSGDAATCLEHARLVLNRFPIHTVGREDHARGYYSLELGVHVLASKCAALLNTTPAAVGAAIPDMERTFREMDGSLAMIQEPLT